MAGISIRDVADGAMFWVVLFLFAGKLLWNLCIPFQLWYDTRTGPPDKTPSISPMPHIDVLLLIFVVLGTPALKAVVDFSHWQVFKIGALAIVASYAVVWVTMATLSIFGAFPNREIKKDENEG